MESVKKEVQIIKPTAQNGKTDKIRVAAYCRVSTDSQDQLNSFFAQLKYYNDYVRGNENMELVDIYADEGITGTAMSKREDFKRLLKDSRNKKIDRVLVKSVTRFARNSLECIEAVRQLKSNGTSVLFENDNIDTERMNSEMILYIKSAFAQGEALSASKRMSTSIRMKMEDGTYIATQAPFGYRIENGELYVIPEEAEIVKEIFRLYLSGNGTNVIAKHFEANYPNNVMLWNRTTIRYILSNEKYIGDCMWQKSYTPNQLPLRNRPNRGERAKYYCEGTQEAIISKEDFKAVQALSEIRKEKYYKGTVSEKSFFYKKIVCRKCGWTYRKLIRSNNTFWTCSRKGLTVDVCRSWTYSEEEICAAFITVYNKLKQNEKIIIDETIAQLQVLKIKANSGNNAIGEIDVELATLGNEKRSYGNLYAKGIIDESIFVEKTDMLKKKMTELRSRRMKLINEDDDEKCIEQIRQLKKILSEGKQYLLKMDKQIFNSIVNKIYAEYDGSLTFVVMGDLELNVEVRR